VIKSSGMKSFNKLDLELVANIARYHRKAHPSPKHLGFSQLAPTDQDVVRKLSALVRIADALDFRHEQRVESVSCVLAKNKTLTIAATARANMNDEIVWALEKGRLLEEVFNLKVSIKRSPTNHSR
jgi:exopolyphosphatase/guanosine-5'-triphosphate,3'-diphosphate pyrophosphatase